MMVVVAMDPGGPAVASENGLVYPGRCGTGITVPLGWVALVREALSIALQPLADQRPSVKPRSNRA